MGKPIPDDSAPFKLDQVSLDTRAAHLPEEMREDFIWLAIFLRDQCNRDTDILHTRFTEAGVKHDKTSWGKILRGRWRNVDSNGDPTGSPVLSVESFTKAIGLLRKNEERREQAGRIPFIMTPTAQGIYDFIEVKRAPEIVCKLGVVVGETGSGKTATFKHFQRRNNHGTTALVEAPATPSMSQFLTDLGYCYGCPKDASITRKKDQITRSVNSSRIIIVDNVQRLYNPRDGDKQIIFSYLQKLQEDTGCTVILSFTPTFERTFTAGAMHGYFEQFEGRAGGRKNFLRLPEFPPEEDVLAIATALKLQNAEKHLDYLVAIAHEPGRIRILFDSLQRGKRKAEKEGRPFSISHIKWARDEEE